MDSKEQKAFLRSLKSTLYQHFGRPATPEKLSEPNGSKTIQTAKKVGVLIAHRAGCTNDSIAAAFGYASGKSASNAITRAEQDYKNKDIETFLRAGHIAHSLHISLDEPAPS